MRTNGLELVPANRGESFGGASNMNGYNLSGMGGMGGMGGMCGMGGMNCMGGGMGGYGSYGGNPMSSYGGSPMPGYRTISLPSYESSPMSCYGGPQMMPSYGPSMSNMSSSYASSPMQDNWSKFLPAACMGGVMPPSYNYNTLSRTNGGMPDMSSYNTWNNSIKGNMVETPNGNFPLWPGTVFDNSPNNMSMAYGNIPNQAKNPMMSSYGMPMMSNMEMGDTGRFSNSGMSSGRGSEPNVINTPIGTLEKLGETRRIVTPEDMEILKKTASMTGIPNGGGNYGMGMGMNMANMGSRYGSMRNY